ncbi:MAG: hypothetical protein ACYC9O_13400, partial [Candidatus Latescibacterota bacterium]
CGNDIEENARAHDKQCAGKKQAMFAMRKHKNPGKIIEFRQQETEVRIKENNEAQRFGFPLCLCALLFPSPLFLFSRHLHAPIFRHGDFQVVK